MYFFGRGISAFFNQLFKWLFWNKTGQKLLFCIVIVFIFFCFIKLGEVAAVEEVTDINYEVKSYYDGVVNDAIIRLSSIWDNIPDARKNILLNSGYTFYFYYGNINGSSYENAKPINASNLYIFYSDKSYIMQNTIILNNDYMGITGYTMYSKTNAPCWQIDINGTMTYREQSSLAFPLFITTYTPYNWQVFINSMRNNDMETIQALLEDIKTEQQKTNEALTNTTPSSETDSFVDVDSSAVDDVSSASVDNVFSTMTTGFANKFTGYDLNTVNSFVWNLNGTRITFYSDTLYKMIRGTFFETLLSMLWYYIFGHYAFVWLSNIIHKIKDGSILDGLEVNEVITKEML